jgi:hypothetical protein
MPTWSMMTRYPVPRSRRNIDTDIIRSKRGPQLVARCFRIIDPNAPVEAGGGRHINRPGDRDSREKDGQETIV